MKFFEDMDSDYKAGITIVAILAGSFFGGFALNELLEFNTNSKALSQGYEQRFDANAHKVIWVKPQQPKLER